MSPSPTSTPDPRPRRAIRALLRDGRARSALALGALVVVFLAAGRHGATLHPTGQRPSSGEFTALPSTTALRVSVSPPEWAGDAADPAAVEAAALESLLTRYDALLRLLEARAIEHGTPALDAAITDLRGLRARTYATARTGVLAAHAGPGNP